MYNEDYVNNNCLPNNSKIYYNGSVWETNNHGNIKIVGKFKSNIFYIKFEDETIIKAYSKSIKCGSVKNRNRPNICGICYIGYGNYRSRKNGEITPEYRLWSGIIHRCYDKNHHKRYKSYEECTMNKRWHNFQNFCEDIPYLKDYNKWKQENNYEIDKDIKIKGNKIYSKDNCMFVSRKENVTEANKRTKTTGLTYIATRLYDEYQEKFTNQSEFARKHNLNRRKVCDVINKKVSSIDGWNFKILDWEFPGELTVNPFRAVNLEKEGYKLEI